MRIYGLAQYRLSSLFVVLFAFALALAIWRDLTREQRAIEAIRRGGGEASWVVQGMLKGSGSLPRSDMYWQVEIRADDWIGDMATLSGLRNVENRIKLHISGKQFANQVLPSLSNVHSIDELKIYDPTEQRFSLESLNSGLRRLDLSWSGITDSDLAQLGRLHGLEYINLSHTRVSDDGLLHLQQMTSVREIDLSSTAISDRGLLYLSRLPRLQTAYFSGTNITPLGIDEYLKLRSARIVRD
jgi:hypothetical protein